MLTTITKSQKQAAELAELIRALAKPDLRVAVFATKSGWIAKVYPEVDVARVQVLVDEKVASLSFQYELKIRPEAVASVALREGRSLAQAIRSRYSFE